MVTTQAQPRPARTAPGTGAKPRWALDAFGLALDCDRPLPGFSPAVPGAPRSGAPVSVQVCDDVDAPPWAPQRTTPVWDTVIDDRRCLLEQGAGGEHRFAYGDEAVFVMSADTSSISCWPQDADNRWWQRFLLDTVLFTASLLRGYEAIHASAVYTERGAIAFVGLSGAGKTSLALELMRRGHRLLCDDVLVLRSQDAAGLPGPPLMNVPAAEPSPGETIAVLADEAWTAIDRVVETPVPVAAICVLQRRSGGGAPHVETLPATPLMLLPHMLAFHHLEGRHRARFELAGELASTTAMLRLSAGLDVPPAALADVLERWAHAPEGAA